MSSEVSPSDFTSRTPEGEPPSLLGTGSPPTPASRSDQSAPDSSTPEKLIDDLAVAHAEHDALIFEADSRRWREGAIALRLNGEFGMSGEQIAAAVNARAAAAPGRKSIKARWVQRLVEVQRVFPTPETRVPGATWETHASAYDVTKIRQGLACRQLRSLKDDEMSSLTAASRALVVDALRQVDRDGINADQWIGSLRQQAELDGAEREGEASRPPPRPAAGDGGASDESDLSDEGQFSGIGGGGGFDPTDSTDDWNSGDSVDEPGADAKRLVYTEAVAAVSALIADAPTMEELNALLSLLREARRKVLAS